MVTHYGTPALPLAPGRSKVSHSLELSPEEKIKLRVALFALFAACLTGLSLFVDVVSSPARFPAYHTRGVLGSDKLASVAVGSWAYYSPYHPAGKFEGSTRDGCVVSQVNIVSSFSPSDRSHRRSFSVRHSDVASYSFNATGHDTQLPEQPRESWRPSKSFKLPLITMIPSWIS